MRLMKTKRAFTLIELLVVVTIIGLLLAVLTPSLMSALAGGRKTGALSNLRQLGQGTMNYVHGNNGYFPLEKAGSGTASWSAMAAPAAAEVWYNAVPNLLDLAPASSYAAKPAGFYKSANLWAVPGARYPANRSTAPMFPVSINSKLMDDLAIRQSEVAAPAQTVFYLESGTPAENDLRSPNQSTYDGQPHTFASRFIARHNKQGALTFCDGHAEARTAADVVSAAGKAHFPPAAGGILWMADPAANPN